MEPFEAADIIRNYARQYERMQELADAFEKVGQVEQTIRERKQIIAQLDAELELVRASLADAKSSEVMATVEAEQLKDRARKVADEIHANALVEAAKYLEDAKAQAEREATRIVDAAVASAEANMLKAEQAASLYNETIANVDAMDSRVVAAENELNRINAAINAARATMNKMLG